MLSFFPLNQTERLVSMRVHGSSAHVSYDPQSSSSNPACP